MRGYKPERVNCPVRLPRADADAIKAKVEARWNPTVKKPFVSFVGSNEATTTAITTITSARADDRINSVFANPDSKDLPLVIASSIAPLSYYVNLNLQIH